MLILAALCSLISLSTSPQIMPEFISSCQFGRQGTSGTTPEGGMYFCGREASVVSSFMGDVLASNTEW